MKNAVNWFEIPCENLDRAGKFYETVMGVTLQRIDFMGIPHGVFPTTDQGVGGALIQDPANKPGTTGCRIFLNAGSQRQLDDCVARIERAGGKVVLPSTAIGDQGTIAFLVDTEGNRVGLHSPSAA